MPGAPSHASAELIAERQRLGLDIRDEMWEGVMHVVPPPAFKHQRLAARLLVLLVPLADERGWDAVPEPGVYLTDRSWRVPDLAVVDPAATSHRGIERRPELVIEIRSPGDDTDRKHGFYAAVGARELLVVHRDTKAIERLVLLGGALAPVEADDDGWHRSTALPVGLRATGDGALLVEASGVVHRLA